MEPKLHAVPLVRVPPIHTSGDVEIDAGSGLEQEIFTKFGGLWIPSVCQKALEPFTDSLVACGGK
jgi:hypothetical protein